MKHFIIVLVPLIIFSSCQKSPDLTYKEWSTGGSSKKKTALLSVPSEIKSEASYQNKKIEFSRQLQNGVPVYGSFIKIVKEDAEIISVQAATSDDLKTKIKVFAPSTEVITRLLKQSGPNFQKMEVLSTEPVIYIEAKKTRLYTLVTVIDRLGAPYEAFFNSEQELTILKRTGAEFSDITAFVYPEGPKLSQLTDSLLKGLTAEPALSNSQLIVTSEASKKINLSSNILKYDPQDERFDQLQVFYYLDKTLNWIKNTLKVSLDGQLNAVVWMGYPEKTNSAFYFQRKIRIGKGDDQIYSNLAYDASIVSHETFHAMIDSLARLPFEGEGGSLNEAFADFFTCLMLDRPYLGESSYLKAPFKRSLLNTAKLSEKNGGLYHDSLIISGTLWELKERLGSEKIKKLALETLIRLNPASNFNSFSEKIKQAGKEQLSTDDEAALNQILSTRGF